MLRFMTEYKEEDFLHLSGIQHFVFCRRQWALIYIEQIWSENYRTMDGRLMHERAHDSSQTEIRNSIVISRAMPVFSRTLGVNGVCDVVEFHKCEEKGVTIFGREGRYIPIPVEYKRGSPKSNDADILQLTAQAICLEEMLCCEIDYGYIYYGESRRREKYYFSQYRDRVKSIFEEMHLHLKKGHTPKVKVTKSCNACSLKNQCMPKLCKNLSANKYIEKMMDECENY